MTEFVIRAITNKPIIVIDHAGEMLAELKRQGNNLNQALKYCYYGETEQARILSCAEELKKTYKVIADAVRGNNAAS